METCRILIVDDEEALCDALQFNLEVEGYEADTAHSAEEALSMDLSHYSLILLDIMMGEMSGFKMARLMKQNPATANIPIIFCTAKDTEDDMVAGLNLGADDYITKPYSIRNIIARVKSVLRRTSGNTPASDMISFESLHIDPEQKRVTVDGEEIKMPRKEFEILMLLLCNRNKIFSREDILKRIWPEEVVVVDRVVDVNITRLRSKIKQYGKHIVTRSGYGYGFQD